MVTAASVCMIRVTFEHGAESGILGAGIQFYECDLHVVCPVWESAAPTFQRPRRLPMLML